MKHVTLFLLDFNGTVLNDVPLWHLAMRKIFETYKLKPPTIEEFYSKMGKDYLDVYRHYGVTASRDEMNAIYGAEYNRLVHTVTLFTGVVETLSLLKRNGTKLGLITMQPEEFVSPLLKEFCLEDLFEDRYRWFHCTDKVQAIKDALVAENTDKNHCCFMGDTPSDIIQGKQAGVQTAVFLPGHLHEKLFSKSPPTYKFRSFKEIGALL